MKKYVVDASILIDAAKNYPMDIDYFKAIWNRFEFMIQQGSLISSEMILDELKDDDLIKWAKVNKKCFLPITKDIQDFAKEILKIYPNLIKLRSRGNSDADPFLISTAVLHKCDSIVTNEKWSIPKICQDKVINIPCIRLDEFIRIIKL